MDFSSLLATANKNAKKVSSTLSELDSEVVKEEKAKIRRLEAEKKARMEEMKKKRDSRPKREPTPEKKFTIPKKGDKPDVDKSKIMAFLEKKEKEKREAEKKKEAEKERLIQLRLQSFGGKANKKLGKHFGMNPIDLQIRYGNDHSHVEALQKMKWREEEEQDNLASSYRDGVYKALAQKRKVEEKLRSSDAPAKPHRVSTSKSNSLFGLSSRHASSRDHFSPPPESSKKKSAPAPPPEKKKKRPPPPAVDFKSLMKAAEDISQGKKTNVDLDSLTSGAPKKAKEEPRSSSSNRPSSSGISRNIQRPGGSGMDRSKPSLSSGSRSREEVKEKMRPPTSTSSHERNDRSSAPDRHRSNGNDSRSSSSHVKSKSSHKEKEREKSNEPEGKTKKDVKGRFQKGPTPPPLIPPAVPGKKYLPGDVRYKAQQAMLAQGGSSQKAESTQVERPSSSSKSQQRSSGSGVSNRERERERGPSSSKSHSVERRSEQGPSSSSSRDRDMDRRRFEKQRELERMRRRKERDERDMQSLEKIRRQERMRAEQRMSLVERERMRERERRRAQYSDEDMEDEEYDSEMDDFIDDSGMDMDEISRMEFEETLKCVNPKYNKKKWRERERQIDDRSMHADYHTIAREEARSAKLGFMEDFYEAKKGKSEAL